MSHLPEAYRWLENVDELPRTIAEGLRLLGVRETPGGASNPVILAWAREIGVADVYRNDVVPWCGLFAGVVAKRAGWPVPVGPLWARNWTRFGQPVVRAGLGDVLAFSRGTGGHVGFYVAEDTDAYHVLGGNQGDAVSIARIEKKRLLAARRPVWKVRQPAGVKRYAVAATGALSTDER